MAYLYRGNVSSVATSGVMVEVPALGPGYQFGPCQTGDFSLEVGDLVLVGQVGDVKEDLTIIGPMLMYVDPLTTKEIRYFATRADRDAALPSPGLPIMTYIESEAIVEIWDGTQWVQFKNWSAINNYLNGLVEQLQGQIYAMKLSDLADTNMAGIVSRQVPTFDANVAAPDLFDWFGRYAANGWGVADSGQTWTVSAGTASNFSTVPATATLKQPNATLQEIQLPAASTDFDYTTVVSVNKLPNTGTGNAVYLDLAGCVLDSNNMCFCRLQIQSTNGVSMQVIPNFYKRTGGSNVAMSANTTSTTIYANIIFYVRVQVIGSRLRMKIWGDVSGTVGLAEPTSWSLVVYNNTFSSGTNIAIRSSMPSGSTTTAYQFQFKQITWNQPGYVPRDPEGIVRKSDFTQPWIIPVRGGDYINPKLTVSSYDSILSGPYNFVDCEVRALFGQDAGLAVIDSNTMEGFTVGHGNVKDHTASQFTSQQIDGTQFYSSQAYPTTQFPVTMDMLFRRYGQGVLYTVRVPSGDASDIRLVALIKKLNLKYNVIPIVDNLAKVPQFAQIGVECAYAGPASTGTSVSDWDAIQQAGCRYVLVDPSCNDTTFYAYMNSGIGVFACNVNRQYQRDRVFGLSPSVTAIMSSDPYYCDSATVPARYQRTTSKFDAYRWDNGMQTPSSNASRRTVTVQGSQAIHAGGALDGGSGPQVIQCLQGYLCPLPTSNSNLKITFDAHSAITVSGDTSRWISIFLGVNDMDWTDPGAATLPGVNGYHFISRMSGGLTIYRIDNGNGTQIGSLTGSSTWGSGTWYAHTITVSLATGAMSLQRASTSVSATDLTYRPLKYLWANFNYVSGQQMRFGPISVTTT